jgi:hypothetical protein
MCPFCLATAAVIASGAAGSGGLGALVAGVVLKKKPKEQRTEIGEEEIRNGDSNSDKQTA